MIFVNIFGGLLRTNKLVAVLQNAIKYGNLTKPLVLRVHGNLHEEALEMSKQWKHLGQRFENYPVYWEQDLDKATQLVVEVAAGLQTEN